MEYKGDIASDDPGNGGNGHSEENTGRTAELSLDATLEILCHQERRRILSYLVSLSEPVATFDELVSHIKQAKAGETGEVPHQIHIKSVLHHVHLPKLMDAGIIDYSPTNQQLRYYGNERLEKWLERVEHEEKRSDNS